MGQMTSAPRINVPPITVPVSNPLLRGWLCPVCGAGVAPWKADHCTKKESNG